MHKLPRKRGYFLSSHNTLASGLATWFRANLYLPGSIYVTLLQWSYSCHSFAPWGLPHPRCRTSEPTRTESDCRGVSWGGMRSLQSCMLWCGKTKVKNSRHLLDNTPLQTEQINPKGKLFEKCSIIKHSITRVENAFFISEFSEEWNGMDNIRALYYSCVDVVCKRTAFSILGLQQPANSVTLGE